MNDNMRMNKAIVAVSAALILVLLLVIGLFVFGQPAASHMEIMLPEQPDVSEPAEEDLYLSENSLLQVTPENAAVALRSLKKPEFYHQTFSISVGESEATKQTTLDLWANRNLMRAQIVSGDETKIILTDGTRVYLWYASEERPVSFRLSGGMTFEDILGLPAFDYLQTLEEGNVTDAEYLVLEEENRAVPCIFFSLNESGGAASRYWIDLSTGLLYEADSVEDNSQVYHVQQVSFDRLADEDEIFADKFLLPDGSSAFTGGT